MHHYCYRINYPEGFYYIGKRTSFLPPQEDTYMGSGVKIKNRKDGTKIILSCHKNPEEAFIAEVQHISGRHKSDIKCLNITKGGSNIKDLNWSEDMRYKRSIISKNYWTPINRQIASEKTITQMTNERRQMLSRFQSERQADPIVRKNQSEIMKVKMIGNSNRLGYKETIENRAKISLSLIGNDYRKGKRDTDETRKRKSDSNKNIPKKRIPCPLCGFDVTPNTLKKHQSGIRCQS